MNQTITVKNVDTGLLREQQEALLTLDRTVLAYQINPHQQDCIDGLINFLDACIDAADYDDLNETIARHLG
jgi:CRISPR/Cas system CSM-associated protein Csm2 small subunit